MARMNNIDVIQQDSDLEEEEANFVYQEEEYQDLNYEEEEENYDVNRAWFNKFLDLLNQMMEHLLFGIEKDYF